ncbi:unnamed protein product [Heligmosomoides polygyrus]|uniref:Peptidase A2 domain-containing protein n=1 Tax=Heligmosomoides polygyrus TaxID=6339 RepID=A0A183GJJ8_HELPZ|nr:unnamed protein product [Heligmosomoides polygyrus]
MNSTPTDVLAADCNGVELMTTQRQSFAVAEEPGVQAVVARMEADGMVTDGELEEEFQRLCGGEERHSTLEVCDQLEKAVKEVLVLVMAEVAKHMRTSNPHREAIEEVGRAAVDSAIVLVRKDALDRQQRELAELRAMKKRFEEQELELQRLKGCVELAPGQTEFGTTAAPDWLQRICERDGIDLASAEAQFVTAWRPEETDRRLKETAKRIERRNLTLANSAAISNAGSDHRRTPKVGIRDSPKRDSASGTQLSRKSKAGLGNANARDCTKSERADSTQHRTSLPARLAEPACRAIEIGSPGVEMVKPGVVCPFFGRKSQTVVEVFGRKWKGLLDTGSEISIIPAKVLLKAKEDGFDIDHDVTEYPIDKALRVYDASGHTMTFVTIVEVPMQEGGDTGRKLNLKAYVTKTEDEEIIIDGSVEVPVVNGSDEPVVFRIGESVGSWEQQAADWEQKGRPDWSSI